MVNNLEITVCREGNNSYICSSKTNQKHICFEGPKKSNGEMAEWLNAAVLKTVKDASPSGVRIPISPQK